MKWQLLSFIFLLFLFWQTGSAQNVGTIQIGSGSETNTGSTAIPVSNYIYNYSQQIVTAAEYSAGGGVAGEITKIRYYSTNVGTATVWNNWTVYLGNTTKTEFATDTDWVPVSEMTQVFSGTIIPVANDWFEIIFTTPFDYTGGNIVVAIDENTPDWTLPPTFSSYISTEDSGIMYRSDSTNPDPFAPPAAWALVDELAQLQFEGAVAACLPPTGLMASNVTDDSADLSWTSSGSNFDISWGEGTFDVGDGTVESDFANGGTLSGLTSGTAYQYYVRQDCGVDGESNWAGPYSFTTMPACGDSFYDTGGVSANYGNDENYTITINPDTAGGVVSVTFSSFDTEPNYDGLMVYDGPDTTAPVISSGYVPLFSWYPLLDGAWNGTGDYSAEGETFTSTHASGALTFVFTSDVSGNETGWEASITCSGGTTDGCLEDDWGQYPGVSFVPSCVGRPEIIVDDAWAGEYSMVTVTNGTEYTFISSIATDYITIGNEAGDTVLASGTGSVTWTSTLDGDVRFYTHVDDACTSETEVRSRGIMCGTAPVEPDYACSQDYDEGLFDLASAITAQAGYAMANDFFVPTGSTQYVINSITAILVPLGGEGDFSTFDVNIMSDNAGTPGAVLETFTGLSAEDVEVHPDLFSIYTAYYVTLDLGGYELPLDSGNSRYWLSIQASSLSGVSHIYWVGYPTYADWNTAPNYQSSDSGATWVLNSYYGIGDIYDSFWSIDATCEADTGSGDTCEDAKIVSSLPYDDAGNTGDYGDDYGNADVPPVAPGAVTTGTGSNYYITGDDVVYAYTPTENQLLKVSTTNEDGWVGLWAFTGCPFDSTVGYHTGISGTSRLIEGLPVIAGETYYFVVSTWENDPQSTDYTIHIEVMEGCEGTPEGGTATVDPTSGPSGAAANFTVTGYTDEIGIIYDWEYSVNGGAWESAGTGADDVNLTITGDHGDVFTVRYAVTCVASDETAYSNEVTYTIDNADCTPTFTNSSDYIQNFQLEDIENMGSGFSAGGYGDFTTMSTDLEADQDYIASLTTSSGSGNHAAAAWIDFNDDNAFDLSERVGTADGIGPNETADLTISIPADAAPGQHTLRVIYQYGVTLVGTDISPCASATYGEGEDYTVNITGGEEPEGCLEADPILPQWPTTTFMPTCSGAPEVIAPNCWTGEYSLLQVSADTEYVFSSSVATDFVTISDENGTVVYASGTGTVTWTSNSDQLIRFYLHLDSDCAWGDDVSRSRIVQCGDILPPPANDDCENAIALACGDSDSGATTFATNSGGNDAGDVFYTFTGTGTEEMVTVSLCGSTYDTAVRVFSDCSLGTEVAFNDDADTGDCAGTLQSEVTFLSDGTSTYIIMVEGYSANVGNYEIALSCAPPPVEPEYGCDQTYDEGIFDLANSISGDLGYTVANDFFVPMDSEVYQIESVSLLLLPIAGSDADFDTFDISILSDNAATPGTPVAEASWTGLTGTSELYPELFAGYNTYMVTIDLDGFELPVDAGADTRYWIQVTAYSASAQNIFWVGYPYTEGWNTASNYQSEDGGATWTQITYDGVGDHYESFWSIDANCELGVSDMNSFDFTYYPNPVKDYLTIDAKNPIVNINVHNLAGQTVMQNVQLKEGKLNMSNLSSGVYVFRVTLEGGQIETFKVIKK